MVLCLVPLRKELGVFLKKKKLERLSCMPVNRQRLVTKELVETG
jgi:hypothetical protein